MPPPDAPPPRGHGLGPHLVGSRVVVRYRVPGRTGPGGGPLSTDVLGVLEEADDQRLLVRPDRPVPGDPDAVHEVVVVPLADVLAAKPVPPRTPPRPR